MSDSREHFELHIPVAVEGESVVALLTSASALSKQSVKRAMQNGALWLTRDRNTRRVRRVKQTLHTGDELHFYFDKAIQLTRPESAQVIADEGRYSVLFKPRGMYCQGSKWGDHCTINRWAEHYFDRPAFIVHRLDRAASGLILIAHQKQTARALSGLFEQRLIKKSYRALVHGEFSSEPLCLDGAIDGRNALSKVALLDYDQQGDRSLLEVEIETGRKHQIRRHLAEAGYAIVGDRLYGKQISTSGEDGNEEDLQLIAEHLAFTMPDSDEEKSYSLPEDLIPDSMKAKR